MRWPGCGHRRQLPPRGMTPGSASLAPRRGRCSGLRRGLASAGLAAWAAEMGQLLPQQRKGSQAELEARQKPESCHHPADHRACARRALTLARMRPAASAMKGIAPRARGTGASFPGGARARSSPALGTMCSAPLLPGSACLLCFPAPYCPGTNNLLR